MNLGKLRIPMMWIIYVPLVVAMMLLSCGNTNENSRETGKTEIETAKLKIFMYEDFPSDKARMLERELKNYFPKVELMVEKRSLPEEAYVAARNRYRGTGLLNDLRTLREQDVVLGLTDKIICTRNELSPDFGIMGISYLNSGLAVVSSKIPKNGGTQTDENLVKLALHELGHAYGLKHCPDQKCYMVDAEHRMKLPQTTDFCNNCRKHLKKRGVIL